MLYHKKQIRKEKKYQPKQLYLASKLKSMSRNSAKPLGFYGANQLTIEQFYFRVYPRCKHVLSRPLTRRQVEKVRLVLVTLNWHRSSLYLYYVILFKAVPSMFDLDTFLVILLYSVIPSLSSRATCHPLSGQVDRSMDLQKEMINPCS